jgi:uncharacterized repeat protein (TIGR01451 family)
MKTKYLLIPFALGLALALVWVLGGRGGAAVAAPRAAGGIEATNAPADELHVCPSGCAYASIQEAVDAANDGDVIKVAAGTYTDVHVRPQNDITTTGFVTQVAYISKTVTVRGGYTTDNWTTSDPENNPTTLDAQGHGRVLYITGYISPTVEGLRITGGDAVGLGGSDMWQVVFDAGGGVYVISATATISNSRVFSNTTMLGGGLCLYSSAATLNNNMVVSNTAGYGGGLGLHSGSATLRGNTISSNTATYGGGLFLNSSAATLSNNTVISNTGGKGGGLLLWDSPATLSDNTVISNTADEGGGLGLDNSDAILTNNVVADNRGNTVGSGLYIADSSPRLLHTTIARNSGGDGSGIHMAQSSGITSTVALTNTILSSHTVGIAIMAGNTITLEGTLWGSGSWANGTDWGGNGTIITGTPAHNHWGDPAFVAPDAGDYHIGPASAAIDMGVDAGVYDDIDGDSRPLDGDGDGVDEFDIGADEAYPTLEVTKQATPDPVQPGGLLTYTIYVTNTGTEDLHATITDTLPTYVTTTQPLVWVSQLIPAPDGVWTDTVVVTVEMGYAGPLINVVEVTTEEGAAGIYTETSAVEGEFQYIYLPLIMRNFP